MILPDELDSILFVLVRVSMHNNISLISWRSVLLVEKPEYTEKIPYDHDHHVIIWRDI
jgi:hypothetical protein